MSDKLSVIERFELKPPLDPFTIYANNPEKAFIEYDPALAKKHEPKNKNNPTYYWTSYYAGNS